MIDLNGNGVLIQCPKCCHIYAATTDEIDYNLFTDEDGRETEIIQFYCEHCKKPVPADNNIKPFDLRALSGE